MAGSRLKRGAVASNRLLQNNISQSQSKASDFNNSLNQAVKGALNQGQATSQNMINQASNKVNNLGDQLNNAIGSAQNAMSQGGGVQIV
jgi:ABC-type transporter Mla subunit MlaD